VSVCISSRVMRTLVGGCKGFQLEWYSVQIVVRILRHSVIFPFYSLQFTGIFVGRKDRIECGGLDWSGSG
jgi:hypothetical protein